MADRLTMPMPPGNPLPLEDENFRAQLVAALNSPFELPSYPFALGGATSAAMRGNSPAEAYWRLRDWYIRNATPGGDFVADRFPLAGLTQNGR